MFIHLGEEVMVLLNDMIAICDLEKTTVHQDTRNYLKTAEEEGFLMTIGEDMPKSFVVVQTEYSYQVYLSPISPATLLKRCNRTMQKNRRRCEE